MSNGNDNNKDPDENDNNKKVIIKTNTHNEKDFCYRNPCNYSICILL